MIPWSASFVAWLVDFYLSATLLLLLAVAGRQVIQQPARRLAVAWATTVGLLTLAIVYSLPGWPRVSIVAVSQGEAATDGMATADANQSGEETRRFADPNTAGESHDSATDGRIGFDTHIDRYQPPLESGGPFSTLARRFEQWRPWAVAWYLAGCVIVGLWHCLGAVQTTLICRSATAASSPLRAQLARIIGKPHRRLRLLVSPHIGTAVALGVFRPAIVLPVRFAEERSRDGLRAALAHEWTHIRNRDLWLLAIGRLLLLALYAHPVYWWLRRQIRDDQEALADASAAGHTSPSDYAEQLLAWARMVPTRPDYRMATALGIWERPMQLKRRIKMLLDERFRVETSCTVHWRYGTYGLLACLALALSILTVRPVPGSLDAQAHAAPLETPEPKDQPTPSRENKLNPVKLDPKHSTPNTHAQTVHAKPAGHGDKPDEEKPKSRPTAPRADAADRAEPGSRTVNDRVLFEDDFEDGLSSQWQAVGLKKEDYRIRDGGLELRVQPGEMTRDTPMLKVVLPFTSSDIVNASVDVTILEEFTEPKELAGLFLIDEHGREFAAKKQRIDGKLVFSPGNYLFEGKPGEEGEVDKYIVKYSPANKDAGPLRILVNRGTAFFQVGPSSGGKYRNFFFSAIRGDSTERGFCLTAAGAPKDSVRWVRFDNFRVERE